jgi:hypothetical protein
MCVPRIDHNLSGRFCKRHTTIECCGRKLQGYTANFACDGEPIGYKNY